jgi:ABC-2 type transport system ATP-binding protein
MTVPCIRTWGLVRDFGRVRALDDVSFEVPSGVVFGFLGPNGAGKTTVIRTLLGLLEPTAGRTEVFGLDPLREGGAVRERCGALLEHHGLYERLTAWQNLDFFARAWHLSSARRQERIAELLTGFGLWDRRHDPVGTWSRGMKQKLAVARAVLHRPALVFLDEPTAGLDPVAGAALRDDLEALADQSGVTIFLTTHNLHEAERLCDLVGVIRRGQVVAYGAPDTLRAAGGGTPVLKVSGRGWTDAAREALGSLPEVVGVSIDTAEATVRLAAEASAAPIVALLVRYGIEIEEVRRERATFEQAFLDLVDADRAADGRTDP